MRHTWARPACAAEAASAWRRPAYPSSSQRVFRGRWMAGSSPAMTRAGRIVVSLATVAVIGVIADVALHAAFAQTPFGAPRSAPAAADGIVGWLLAKQSEFYREMS